MRQTAPLSHPLDGMSSTRENSKGKKVKEAGRGAVVTDIYYWRQVLRGGREERSNKKRHRYERRDSVGHKCHNIGISKSERVCARERLSDR